MYSWNQNKTPYYTSALKTDGRTRRHGLRQLVCPLHTGLQQMSEPGISENQPSRR